MEPFNTDSPLLELIERPVLCVRDGKVIRVNRAAAQMQIAEDSQITQYLPENSDAYQRFQSGQLFLNLTVLQINCGAVVIRSGDMDYFILDQPDDRAHLQTMALAAQQLRVPLSNVMTITDQFLMNRHLDTAVDLRAQAGKISKGLFQLLRILSNMADVHRYADPEPMPMENCNLTAFICEIFEKAQALMEDSGVTLRYSGPKQPIFGMVAKECLERGIYNMLSNAVKFSPKGGVVEAMLTQNEGFLSVSIQDSGRGIPADVFSNLFTRYRRQPGIEDGRYGIGLGMTMVRAAATVHGGTVLVDSPNQVGTRVTLTIGLKQRQDCDTVRSPVMSVFDYAGGWDHALTELSELLDSSSFLTE